MGVLFYQYSDQVLITSIFKLYFCGKKLGILPPGI